MKNSKVRQVWNRFDFHTAHQSTDHDPVKTNKYLSAIFCPGPFYNYIFDFGNYQFVHVSSSYNTIVGKDPETLTIDDLIASVHPEDQDFFAKCEQTAAKFLFGHIPPNQMLDYKVSYCFRIKTADGTYKLFLHQALALSLDEEGRLGRVIGVHTDISHSSTTNNYKLSFFGINGAPSYTNIDVYGEGASDFRPNEFSLTKREQEILRLLAEGASTKNIAETLFIAAPTVKKHRENMLKKTKAKNMAHLVSIGIKNGLI